MIPVYSYFLSLLLLFVVLGFLWYSYIWVWLCVSLCDCCVCILVIVYVLYNIHRMCLVSQNSLAIVHILSDFLLQVGGYLSCELRCLDEILFLVWRLLVPPDLVSRCQPLMHCLFQICQCFYYKDCIHDSMWYNIWDIHHVICCLVLMSL